jgi:hypothetical protein
VLSPNGSGVSDEELIFEVIFSARFPSLCELTYERNSGEQMMTQLVLIRADGQSEVVDPQPAIDSIVQNHKKGRFPRLKKLALYESYTFENPPTYTLIDDVVEKLGLESYCSSAGIKLTLWIAPNTWW